MGIFCFMLTEYTIYKTMQQKLLHPANFHVRMISNTLSTSTMFKFYNQYIFPPILNQVMQTPSLMDARRELLLAVHGDVLEIGFGTGINLPFYSGIDTLYALEPSPHVLKLAESRFSQANFEIRHLQTGAEAIPLATASISNIISTWTMCSIPQIQQALTEIHRVLSDDGTFHFIEHVLSDQANIQRWQNRFNPIQKKLADGCNLNRNIEQLILDAGFEFVEKRYFNAQGIPTIGHRMLLGRVKKR
jgi:SAM-dependent methyltransferase